LALLEKRGLQIGPTGKISRVEVRGHDDEEGDAHGGHEHGAKDPAHGAASSGGGSHDDSAHYITIGGQSIPMHAHGRVANGPTDLLQWEGRTIRLSFIGTQDGTPVITYLEAEPQPQAAAAELPAPQAVPTAALEQAAAEGPTRPRTYLIGLVVVAAALGLLLFFRRRRVS
jgi:hypothetical protein